MQQMIQRKKTKKEGERVKEGERGREGEKGRRRGEEERVKDLLVASRNQLLLIVRVWVGGKCEKAQWPKTILFLCPFEGDVSVAQNQTARIRACVVENFTSDPETQAPLLYTLVGAHRHASRVYISAMIAVEPPLAPQSQYSVVREPRVR